jgi:hypothetical protein
MVLLLVGLLIGPAVPPEIPGIAPTVGPAVGLLMAPGGVWELLPGELVWAKATPDIMREAAIEAVISFG